MYLSRVGLVQQQCDVHAKVRVAIDALDYEYNHDSRKQTPRLTAARLQLAVGRRGLALRGQGDSAPSARLSWLRVMREYTQEQQLIVLGSDALLKKYHVKRLGTSLRGQTRV